MDELLQVCKDACAAEFSEADGYSTSIRRLSGALDGASIAITRTDPLVAGGLVRFSALVSLQRYLRSQDAESAEIRIVATCRHDPTGRDALETTAEPGALSRLSVAGCAVGTMGIGAAGLEISGLLATWGQALLLIPAFMAWRLFMALRLVASLRKEQAKRQLTEDRGLADERERARARDQQRWQRLTEILLAQREAVAERFIARPFRSPGARLGNVGARSITDRAALSASVLPVPAPIPVLPT